MCASAGFLRYAHGLRPRALSPPPFLPGHLLGARRLIGAGSCPDPSMRLKMETHSLTQ